MRISTTLVIMLLLVSLLPLTLLGIINYSNAEKEITSQTINKLNTLADLNEEAIRVVITNDIERLESFTTRQQLKVELEKYNTTQDPGSLQFITNLISQIRSQIASIKEITVLNPDGLVIASTDEDELGLDHSNDIFFLKGREGNDVSIFFKDKNQIASRYLVGPLVLDGKVVGVAVITSDLTSFNKISQSFAGSSETGESYLLMRDNNGDAVVITPLRFDPAGVLNVRIPKSDSERPASQAMLGKEITITDEIDYRGVNVLAVTRYIEGHDLGLVVKIDKIEAIAPLENLRVLTVIVTTAGGFTVIAASIFFGSSISSPLRALRDRAVQISKGNLEGVDLPKIGSRWDDEIRELSIHFDEMRRSIKSMKNDLQKTVSEKTQELVFANEALTYYNESLASMNQALARQKDKLREADKTKEEFSAMMTHELRTPLVPVIGYSELLLDGTLGTLTEKQKETIQIINSSASNLLRLISDLLDARKLEMGKMKFEKKDVLPQELVDQCVTSFTPLARSKGIQITVNMTTQSNETLTVRCDGKRIRQVLDNLVNNAIKFSSSDDGKIEVSVKNEEESGTILFAVKDNGIGIPKEKQANIFQKFYQADTSMTRNAGGTGLGLSICKAIVEAHDGRIWFESDPDYGTTFYFSIPQSTEVTAFMNRENASESVSI